MKLRFSAFIAGFCLSLFVLPSVAAVPLSVQGTVTDSESGEPIAAANVRVLGTGISVMANESGEYHLTLPDGTHRIRFSHIAYYSRTDTVAVSGSTVTLDIALRPSIADLGTIRVYERKYDDGQRIIAEAIRHKQEILTRVKDCRYDAYTKMVVTDVSKEDSAKILLLTETQSTALWEAPDKFKKIISARKQSANLSADENLVAVDELLNFNRNRLELGPYSVITPTAVDAMKYYNYYLIDSTSIDSQLVYVLEIEPKNPDNPLLQGTIYIADNTYDVVHIDATFSDGVDFTGFSDLHYAQEYAFFRDEYWLPIRIQFHARFALNIPFPGIPSRLEIDQSALLYDYAINEGHPPDVWDEYAIEVARGADDSLAFEKPTIQSIPLTSVEERAYHYIDSIENLPPGPFEFAGRAITRTLSVLTFGGEDFFRYNRVEGAFAGVGVQTEQLVDGLQLRFKTGYPFEFKRWSHQYGLTYEFDRKSKLFAGGEFYNRVIRRPTLLADREFSATVGALIDKFDPLDYYLTKGVHLFTGFKPFDHVRLTASYRDFRDRSVSKNTDWSMASQHDTAFENPPIAEGTLRSVGMELVFDSRSLIRNKGRTEFIQDPFYTRLEIGLEGADPDIIDNDFDFRRYSLRFFHRFRLGSIGVTTLRLNGGYSRRDLPPQRYFSLDYGGAYFAAGTAYSTTDRNNLAGDEAASLYVLHQFKRSLWVKSGIPIIKDIPLWLSVYGGAAWTRFAHTEDPLVGERTIVAEHRPYTELGFGLGNLTPFLSPLNLAIDFTWQLSDYGTTDFTWQFGIEM